MGKLSTDFCTWIRISQDEYAWETDCNEVFIFGLDGPEQNGFNYCPFCSLPIIPEAT